MGPEWLEPYDWWVDGIIRDKRVAARFLAMLLSKGRRDFKILNVPKQGKTVSTQDSAFPPKRAMRLDEKYHFAAVIHDTVCEDTTRIERWFYRGKLIAPRDKKAAQFAAIAIKRDVVSRVKELVLDAAPAVFAIFEDVRNDLQEHVGVSLKPVPKPSADTGKQPQGHIEIHVHESDKKAETPKKSPKKQTAKTKRKKATELTPKQKKVVELHEGHRQSFVTIARLWGVEPQSVQQLYRRATANPGYKKRRSVNLRKSKTLHANIEPASS